jgi:hypothetical protein
MAMAIKSSSAGRYPAFPMANLNLLPAPYHPKPISLTKVIGLPGTACIVGLIVPMIMLMQNSSFNIAAMQNELDATYQITNQRLLQKQELKKRCQARMSLLNLFPRGRFRRKWRIFSMLWRAC